MDHSMKPSFQDSASIICLYGDMDRTNRVVLEFHVFSLIITLSIAPMLLFNPNLKRLYSPLASIVNAAILLQILSDLLYFAYYPYAENEGNCIQMITGRIYTAIIMFGELHQIYLLANMLGLGNYRFNFQGWFSVSLDTTLKLTSLCIGISLLHSSIYLRSFMMTRNVWCMTAASLQIYFVWLSSTRRNTAESNLLFSMQSSVKVFDKLSKLQLLPATFCFVVQLLKMRGVDLIAHFDNITLMLNEVLNLLFYLKVLLVKENADISVELVNI